MLGWLDTLEDIRTRDFSKASQKQREKAARDVINICSYASAVVSISPIPFSDVVLMLPVQSAMVMTVGHIYGRRVDKASARDLIMELGATAGVGFLARQGIKAILPVFGALLTVPAAFAANWAMGRVAMEYFQNPGVSKAVLEEIFKKAKEEGSSLFSKEQFDKFRKRNEDSIKAVATEGQEDEDDEEEAPVDEEGDEEEAAPPPKRKAAAPKAVEKKPLGKKPLGKPAAKAPAGKKTAAKKPPAGKKLRVVEAQDEEPAFTVRTVVEEELPRRLKANEDLATRLKAVVHLDISGDGGGQWTLEFGKPGKWVSSGLKGSPRVTVRCADDDFLQIVTGQKDARMAVLSGTLQVEPLDLELAGQIGQLFS
ncbi:MAG TPA: SCP2 sterol-binding domain-containing protein [Myxococcaceae bacterium]|nr:SCP2 sterol-binding domain-containing protein [Myxococcaceae bacterium]